MSPEQAKGRAADQRSDIFALGCMLYEMVTGRQAFHGDDVSEVLAAVLKSEPDFNLVPRGLNTRFNELLRRCLNKNAKIRWHCVGDLRMEIDAAASATLDLRSDERKLRWVPWAIAMLAFISTVMIAWVLWPTAPNRAPIRLSADLGVNAELFIQLGSAVLLSPDGKLLAFAASSGNEPSRIYLRKLNELVASALPGTENARNPFFSPDGRWIAFFADGRLKKVSVNGGPPVPLYEALNDRGGSWGEDGFIVFAPIPLSGLVRVSSSGGTPEAITKLQAGELTHRWPQVIQGGRAVLYTASSTPAEYGAAASIVVESIPGGDRRVLRQGASYARYLPSGHLVYLQELTTLFAAPFDLQQRKITGDSIPVIEGIQSSVTSGATNFAFSTAGSIAYVAGTGPSRYSLAWMDQEGKTQPLRPVPALYRDIRVSPDGTRIAYATQGQSDIWVYDWAHETISRVTSNPASDLLPVWTPDGQRITFASARDKSINIYWQSADGSSEAQRLTESANSQLPLSWHPAGKFLAFREQTNTDGKWDLMVLPMNGDAKSGWKPGTPTPFLSGPGSVLHAAFSPDGNWIAYQSNESGTYGIYVRPFPGPGRKFPISSAGGDHPVWSPKTKELFYRAPDRRIMVVSYSTAGGSFQAEKPRVWSEGTFPNNGLALENNSVSFDIDANGKRFAIIKPDSPSAAKFDKVVLIFNFFDELRRMTSASSK
jgi:serine/threonine-protein kinase